MPAQESDLPSARRQAINMVKAVSEHARSGWRTAPVELAESRMSVCRGCEFLTKTDRCTKCGCHMLVKTTWVEQKCPIGKW